MSQTTQSQKGATSAEAESELEQHIEQGEASQDDGARQLNACMFQEHEPLYHLLSILPQRAQKGLFTLDIEYTTIDVSQEYIALGTTVGVIFLYDRLALNFQKLNTNNKNEIFTCVRMQQSVDYVVAGGTASGQVFIFQLPSFLPGRAKQLHMSTVQGLHVGHVTSLEWSQNTEKLFSGDQDGNVVCTEMDYTENKSQSYVVCQEPHPIVQLSYAYRTLLVSTTFRSVLCGQDKERKIRRIGTKDRKILGNFGACFVPGAYRPEEAILYAARPGLRLWRSNIKGKVETTYMFRDLLHGNTPMIAVLPDTICNYTPGKIEEVNFGQVHILNSSHLVTWSGGTVFVVDPGKGKLLGWVNSLGHIQSVSVCGGEVFLLRHGVGRRIIRIAQKRDPLNEQVTHSPSPSIESLSTSSERPSFSSHPPTSPVQIIQHTANAVTYGIMDAIRGVSEKIQSVQEGQQILGGGSADPPWGYAPSVKRTSSAEETDVDSCKEASSQSSMSSSLHDDTGSPFHDVIPQADIPECHDGMQKAEADVAKRDQPEIRLESDDVISVHIPHSISDSVVVAAHRSMQDTGDKTKDDSLQCSAISSQYRSMNSASEQVKETLGRRVPIKTPKMDDLDAQGATASNGIVFSPKPKKNKKKKHKGTSKMVEDSQSLDSLETNSLPGSYTASSGTASQESQETIKERPPTLTDSSDKPTKETGSQACLPAQVFPLESGKGSQGNHNDSDRLAFEADLPPVKELGSLGIATLNISTNTRLGQIEKSQLPQFNQVKVHSQTTMDERKAPVASTERVVSRPIDLPAPRLLSNSDEKAGILLSSSAPHKPVPITMPSYERSSSLTSPTDNDGGLTSSFHEDSHKASFEAYARQTSETASTPETLSPTKHDSQQFYRSPDSSDDFYTKYRHSVSSYSLENMISPEESTSIEEALDYNAGQEESSEENRSSLSMEPEVADPHHQFTDTWTEFLAPGNLYSMCLTERHIWVVDKSERLQYSSLSGPGLTWRKVDEPARQIAVSPSGHIVWRLYHGSVYAGTKITTRAPAGLNWVEVLRKEVAHIAVDDTIAWYVKHSGDVMVQRGLSRDRPSFRSLKVPCQVHLIQIVCRNGVVWGVTESGCIIVRTGISLTREEGVDWEPLKGEGNGLQAAHLSLGPDGVAWMVDVAGNVWFTTGVTQRSPFGSGAWWQVSMSEYLMQDAMMGHTLSDLPQNLSKLVAPVQPEKGGLVTTGANGVWVSPGYKHLLHVCRGSLLGHRWDVAAPSGMAPSAKWLHVSASAASKKEGLIWAQQPNGAIFTFPPQAGKVTEVSQPAQEMRPFVCMSATSEAVWGLTNEAKVYIRKGMASHCPHGLTWVSLDLMQLGSVQVVHLSCGSQNVWAVDNMGLIYLRIGNQPPNSKHLNPAWVPVEGAPHHAGARFTRVYTGISEWMVWAVDSRKCVYVRKGVSDAMPIGTHWLYVPGTPAEDLVMSERLVYGLNQNRDILVRYGIQEDNPAGDYWRKIPCTFNSLSVTATDNLWGINKDGQLCHRDTHFLPRKTVLGGLTPSRANVTISEDWEVI